MENRTYGVEIECVCNITRSTLADRIDTAFVEAGINHSCGTSHYHHNTDGRNYTCWEVQSDASIRTTDLYRHQVEVVSPVLKGQAGLAALKVVCDVVNQFAKINTSCGLHVHHGVDSWNEVEAVSRAFREFQDTIYNGLPRSRARSHYSKKWDSSSSLAQQIRFASCHRYTGLNLCSYSLRKTIEFRCAAGSTEFKKISNWILFTQGLVEAAIKSWEWASSGITGLVEFVASNQRNDYQAIRGTKPSRRSRIATALNSLVAEGRWTKQELIDRLITTTNCAESSAYAYVTDCLNDKYNNLITKVVVQDGVFKFAETSRRVDPDYQRAAEWFRGRYNHFQNAA